MNDATTAAKNAAISARIIAAMQNGATVQDALDTVCGEGTFEKLAGDVYDALNAKTEEAAAPAIRFNKFHVTDGTNKARCSYSLDNRCDRRNCVTIYAKDYNSGLGKMFNGAYKNETDSMTDYFDQGKAVLFEDHPQYAAARARVESFRN